MFCGKYGANFKRGQLCGLGRAGGGGLVVFPSSVALRFILCPVSVSLSIFAACPSLLGWVFLPRIFSRGGSASSSRGVCVALRACNRALFGYCGALKPRARVGCLLVGQKTPLCSPFVLPLTLSAFPLPLTRSPHHMKRKGGPFGGRSLLWCVVSPILRT